jgi:hypothetical protein
VLQRQSLSHKFRPLHTNPNFEQSYKIIQNIYTIHRNMNLDMSFRNIDVVIPFGRTTTTIYKMEGFCRYNQLVHEGCEEYLNLPPRLRRQFAIDNIIMPLLNEQRNFYKFDRQEEQYVMVDLSNKANLNSFIKAVVSLYIRDTMHALQNQQW